MSKIMDYIKTIKKYRNEYNSSGCNGWDVKYSQIIISKHNPYNSILKTLIKYLWVQKTKTPMMVRERLQGFTVNFFVIAAGR